MRHTVVSVMLVLAIIGISETAHAQSIAWSQLEGPDQPVTTFTSFERFNRPGEAPIQIQGGRLESLTIVPLDLD